MNYPNAIEIASKLLSLAVIPTLLWINSVSVDLALLKNKAEVIESRVKRLEDNQTNLTRDVANNSGTLREIKATLTIVHELVRDIRANMSRTE
tara:strand:- start:552 stop:830 length:279 start_codon:yes stop_codon:yes gene_type:complete